MILSCIQPSAVSRQPSAVSPQLKAPIALRARCANSSVRYGHKLFGVAWPQAQS
ncbi:hypothetical protein BJP36_44260 [Moorena producens JHB]|uniref:Uncharacterized protein n=1 Tax=Moorena producens (strain JHB) TaxID=1454205 RepID=A0A9Q9STL0_MOOP1|nr:hypothetical protein [Moorena producens]WAN69377.1 hypothetical protein BJP36_44260 [Moorena producens JHB]